MPKELMTEFRGQKELQSRFMKLVMKNVPDVLSDLRNEVFPLFRNSLLAGIKPVGMPPFPLHPRNEEETKAMKPVFDWSKKWGLDADWVRVKALINMAYWHHDKDTGLEWESSSVLGGGGPLDQIKLPFEYVFSIGRGDYEEAYKKAEKEFRQRFRECWDWGLANKPAWYEMFPEITDGSLNRFIAYAVAGKKRKEVAVINTAIEPHTLSEDIHRIADLLDLRVPNRRGRPKRSGK